MYSVIHISKYRRTSIHFVLKVSQSSPAFHTLFSFTSRSVLVEVREASAISPVDFAQVSLNCGCYSSYLWRFKIQRVLWKLSFHANVDEKSPKCSGKGKEKKIEELSSMTTEQTPSADKDDVIWLRAQNSLEIDVVGDCDLGDDSSEAHIYCLHKLHYTK